jgi:imidazolonepropionase
MELENSSGSIAVGKKANLIVTNKADSLAIIPYDFGNNPVSRMIIDGEIG